MADYKVWYKIESQAVILIVSDLVTVIVSELSQQQNDNITQHSIWVIFIFITKKYRIEKKTA